MYGYTNWMIAEYQAAYDGATEYILPQSSSGTLSASSSLPIVLPVAPSPTPTPAPGNAATAVAQATQSGRGAPRPNRDADRNSVRRQYGDGSGTADIHRCCRCYGPDCWNPNSWSVD